MFSSGLPKKIPFPCANPYVFPKEPFRHFGVAGISKGPPSGTLAIPSFQNTFPNGPAVFPGAFFIRKEFFRSKPGHRHVKIHPIQNRTGKAFGIAPALRGGTAARDFRITVVTASARVGGTDEKNS